MCILHTFTVRTISFSVFSCSLSTMSCKDRSSAVWLLRTSSSTSSRCGRGSCASRVSTDGTSPFVSACSRGAFLGIDFTANPRASGFNCVFFFFGIVHDSGSGVCVKGKLKNEVTRYESITYERAPRRRLRCRLSAIHSHSHRPPGPVIDTDEFLETMSVYDTNKPHLWVIICPTEQHAIQDCYVVQCCKVYHLKARNKYAKVRSNSLDDEMSAMNCNETTSQARPARAIFIESGPRPHSQSLIFFYFRLSCWQQICGFYSRSPYWLCAAYRHVLA